MAESEHALGEIRAVQTEASTAALIGSHSDSAEVERMAYVLWRRTTMMLWAATIGVAAVGVGYGFPSEWSWALLAARGPFGALLLTLGLAIRYTARRAEDHRAQELLMTHTALSIRSVAGYVGAFADLSEGEHASNEFLSRISATLFTSEIEALVRRSEARRRRNPKEDVQTLADWIVTD